MPVKSKNMLTTLSSAKTRTFVLLFVIVLIIGIIIAFMNKGASSSDALAQQKSQSTAVPSRIKATPGNIVSPQYKEYQTAENAARATKALKTQTSAIPTIVGATTDQNMNNASGLDAPDGGKNDSASAARTQFGNSKETDFLGASFSKSALDREREKQEAAVKKERERIEKMRSDKENDLLRQQNLERDQRLAAQEQKAYQDSLHRISEQMKQYAGKTYDEWSKYPKQQYVQGQLASKSYRSNDPDTSRKAGSHLSLHQMQDGLKPGKVVVVKTNPKMVIKAGTILFGVLDTAINTDEPGPVLATVINGRFHGAKMLGSLKHEKQQETVSIEFNQMNVPKRLHSVGVAVVAIDPETARTALASNVNHHYLLRYGTLFASSFVAGYGNAIQQQGSTTTVSPLTGATTTSYPPLNNRQIFLAALGQVGTQWAAATREYFQTPYTVTVNQGTSIGLLFMTDADLSSEDGR